MVYVYHPFSRFLRKTHAPHRIQSYMDRTCIYENHNRVFYLYYLGMYNSRPFYHFGETNDMDAKEFYMKSHVPFYDLLMYIPVDTEHQAFTKFTDLIQPQRLTLPVHNLEHMETFTTFGNDIETIIEKVEQLYRVNVDEWA